MTKTLIRGGCVLTMGRTNHAVADVLIDGDTIAAVGPGVRARDAEVVDGTGTIVMPGFVDTHRHAWESLFRNLGGGLTAVAGDVGPHFTADDVYAATLVGLLGAVDAGITTVADWCGVASRPEYLDAALQAHTDSGIRSVFIHAAPAWDGSTWQSELRRIAAGAASPRLTVAAGVGESGHGDLDAIAGDSTLARELGLRIHAHADAKPSQAGLAAAMADRSLLGPDVTLVHCSHFEAADLDALESTGAAVSLTPSSEMAAGLGGSPIQGLLDRGIRPGLGVDVERLAPGDLFAQMRALISVQHATVFERKLAGKAGVPHLLTTREVIRYATVDGAAAIGLGDETGVIEPGRRADVIVLRADSPNIHPVNDAIGAVVWGMDTSNVDWVFVGGRALKRNGEIVADSARARTLAIAARDRMTLGAGSGR